MSNRRGFGLASMRERTELSGGCFAIETREQRAQSFDVCGPKIQENLSVGNPLFYGKGSDGRHTM